MIAYRLAKARYADALLSSGVANRWNRSKQYVIYTSQSVSLCALELLAHTNGIRPVDPFKIMLIDIAGDSMDDLKPDDLPINWYSLSAYSQTQTIGSIWYESNRSLVLKVPSAVIPTEYNFVINTSHPDFNEKVKLLEVQNFFWDTRFPC